MTGFLLSRKEGRVGMPERPLSALGALSYRNYWTLALMKYLQTAPDEVTFESESFTAPLDPLTDASEILRHQPSHRDDDAGHCDDSSGTRHAFIRGRSILPSTRLSCWRQSLQKREQTLSTTCTISIIQFLAAQLVAKGHKHERRHRHRAVNPSSWLIHHPLG